MSLRYSIDRIYIQPMRLFARSLAQLASPSDGRPVGHTAFAQPCVCTIKQSHHISDPTNETKIADISPSQNACQCTMNDICNTTSVHTPYCHHTPSTRHASEASEYTPEPCLSVYHLPCTLCAHTQIHTYAVLASTCLREDALSRHADPRTSEIGDGDGCNLSHTVWSWGMYTAPTARQHGRNLSPSQQKEASNMHTKVFE